MYQYQAFRISSSERRRISQINVRITSRFHRFQTPSPQFSRPAETILLKPS